MTNQYPQLSTTVHSAVSMIRADQEAVQKLIAATSVQIEIPRRLADSLNFFQMTLPPSLIDSIASANRIGESFHRIHQPVLQLSDSLHETVHSAKALAERYEAITVPVLAQQRRIQDSLALTVRPAILDSMAKLDRLPRIPKQHLSVRRNPPVPIVRRPSKAERIVAEMLERLNARQRAQADSRYSIELVVLLPTGEYIRVSRVLAKQDGLIQVLGKDQDGCQRERYIAPEVIQYEYISISTPPNKPNLRLVKDG